MKYLRAAAALLLTAVLCGCSVFPAEEEAKNLAWHDEFDKTVSQVECAARCVTEKQGEADPVSEWEGYYTADLAETVTKENGEKAELYYLREDGGCSVCFFNPDYRIWVKTPVAEDENLFYPAAILDRLRKFGAFIDRGELVFDEEQQKYIGRDLSGHYLCGEEEHRVLSLEISIKAGRVSGFTEVYEPVGEEEGARYIDTVVLEVTGFHIELPEKIYTPEDIEKLPSF